jgi:hypothetical protein
MGEGDLKFGLFPYGEGNQVACFLMVRGPKQTSDLFLTGIFLSLWVRGIRDLGKRTSSCLSTGFTV